MKTKRTRSTIFSSMETKIAFATIWMKNNKKIHKFTANNLKTRSSPKLSIISILSIKDPSREKPLHVRKVKLSEDRLR